MQRTFLKSKLHQATVTHSNLLYEGSLTIDEELMEKADILPNEKVSVYNISNGQRFDTYAIIGKRGKKEIGLNGAAARLGEEGDRVIIVTYCNLNDNEISDFEPNILVLDENNDVKYTK